MNDLELIKKCADRIGIAMVWDDGGYVYAEHYNPLVNDAQFMSLLFLLIEQEWTFDLRANLVTSWSPHHGSHCQSLEGSVTPEVLRRFICECVAELEGSD